MSSLGSVEVPLDKVVLLAARDARILVGQLGYCARFTAASVPQGNVV